MMRSTLEIVEDVKDGKRPEYEEIRYALLVYVNLFNLEHRQLRECLLAEKETPAIIRKMKAENSFSTYKQALNTSPKEFLGWNNDPDNPEYQKMREAGNRLINKVIGEERTE